jgi:hypothetical protein
LVRGYQRLAEGGDPSAYRQPGSDEQLDRELSDWVAGLVPSVAPYVRSVSVASTPSVELSTVAGAHAQEAVATVHTETAPAVRTRLPGCTRTLFIWLGLVAAFVLAWSMPGGGGVFAAVAVGTLVVAGVVLLSWRAAYLNRLAFRRLSEVVRAMPDDLLTALRALEGLRPDPPGAAFAANVELVAGGIAYRLGELEPARVCCDRALGLINRAAAVPTNSADQIDQHDARLAPELREQVGLLRLSVLAALGRHDEARAEYGRSKVATRADAERIALFERIHAADLDGAYQLVAARSLDMALTPHDEALGDAVRMAAGRVSDAERRRIEAALEADPDMQAWLLAVAPALLADSHTRGRQETALMSKWL